MAWYWYHKKSLTELRNCGVSELKRDQTQYSPTFSKRSYKYLVLKFVISGKGGLRYFSPMRGIGPHDCSPFGLRLKQALLMSVRK